MQSMPSLLLLVVGPGLRMILEPHLCGLLHLLNVLLMVLNKSHPVVCLLPFVVKLLRLLLINVIVVVSLLDIVTYFLFHYLSPFVVQHPLFRNSVYTLVVLICLLFLGNCMPPTMLSHIVFKIILLNNPAIWSHFR